MRPWRAWLLCALCACGAPSVEATATSPSPGVAPVTAAPTGTGAGSAEPRPTAGESPESPTEANAAPAPAALEVVRLATEDQDALDALVRSALDAGLMPGAVLLLGRRDGVIFERAYGARDAGPPAERMTTDTVFDLASLTKPVVTATAVMQLAERGEVELDAPVGRYLPRVANGEATLRQLLLHTSGWPAVDPLSSYGEDRAANLARIAALPAEHAPGTRYVYSDLGFIALGALVERVSGEDLASYATAHILGPLGMTSAAMGGLPGETSRVAPTEERDDAPIRNVVDDPRAYRLGGYAGNAGLFASARDLARFARMMLGRGALGGARVLEPASVDEMIRAVALPGRHRRGLGWDMDPDGSAGLSGAAFGHGGYTGTWLYVDPERDLFIVLLTNVVHGGRAGTLGGLRADVARIALRALPRVAPIRPEPDPPVLAGVDVLDARDMHLGLPSSDRPRVGLLTHGAARRRDGLRTVDLFVERPEVELVRIFTPEHGLDATQEGRVRDARYRGVPVTSLFGGRRAPTVGELRELDVLVVDLMDVGTRYYTYPSTLLAALRVAAEVEVPVVVLDRPNPLGGARVEGPVSSAERASFINSFPLPIRHGLTLGELARLFVQELQLEVQLDVIAPHGWRRDMTFRDTGLAWSAPSPNLPTPEAALLYPAIALVEGANVSVGRGTDSPFALVGAPYLDSDSLAARLRSTQLEGVRFAPEDFTPRARPYRGRVCHGVRVEITDAGAFDAARTGFALLLALHAEAPRRFDLDRTGGLVADDELLAMVRAGATLDELQQRWRPGLVRFLERRARLLSEP